MNESSKRDVRKINKKQLKLIKKVSCSQTESGSSAQKFHKKSLKNPQKLKCLLLQIFESTSWDTHFLNIENFAQMKEKTSLQSVLKGDLPTCSNFANKWCVLGVGVGGV